MQEVKTAGLVLSSANLNDNDRIFTIQTRDIGKITAISKGIRSHKHKDFAALQNFCYSDMVISQKGAFGYVSSANIINNFYGIRNSVEQMSVAAYFADIVKSFPEEMPLEDDYFNFILNSFYLVGKAEEKCKDGDVLEYLLRLKSVFEFKTVCFAGFMPDADVCSYCGTSKDIEYFDTSSGNAVCRDCHINCGGEPVKINTSVQRLIRFLAEADYKSVFAFGGAEGDVKTIAHITEKYIINTLEIYPASLDYLKNVINSTNND